MGNLGRFGSSGCPGHTRRPGGQPWLVLQHDTTVAAAGPIGQHASGSLRLVVNIWLTTNIVVEHHHQLFVFHSGVDDAGDNAETGDADDANRIDGEDGHWRNSNALSVPSDRIQFQITLEEGESGNEDDWTVGEPTTHSHQILIPNRNWWQENTHTHVLNT